MLTVNEYFDGRVKSIGFEDSKGRVTSGVMEPGDCTFSTSSKELMVVVTGELVIKRPEDTDWVAFPAGKSFHVPSDVSFDVKVSQPMAHICRYG